jgi:hypothetical protein
MIPTTTALASGVTATLDLFPHAAFRAVNGVVVGPFTKRGIGAPPVVGIGTVTVATTGRRSGRAHEVPLAAARLGDTVVVSTVRRNSEWVRNVESDPTTTIWLDVVPARPRRRSSDYPVSPSPRCASTASRPDPTRPTVWTIGLVRSATPLSGEPAGALHGECYR